MEISGNEDKFRKAMMKFLKEINHNVEKEDLNLKNKKISSFKKKISLYFTNLCFSRPYGNNQDDNFWKQSNLCFELYIIQTNFLVPWAFKFESLLSLFQLATTRNFGPKNVFQYFTFIVHGTSLVI